MRSLLRIESTYCYLQSGAADCCNMTRRNPSLTVYLTPQLKADFEQIRADLADEYVRFSNTQLGEVAIKQFIKQYKGNINQLVLDLGLNHR